MGGMEVFQAASAQANVNPRCPTATPGALPPPECLPMAHRLAEPRSLTVIGQGQITAPADSALLEFRFGNREPVDFETPVNPGREAILKPIVDALVKLNVSPTAITLQTASQQSPKLLLRIENPTQERMQQLVSTVERSLPSNSPLFLQSTGATYAVNTCEPIVRAARRIALRDAQRQLTGLAEDVNVQLGQLLQVTVLPLVGSPSSTGCGTKIGVPASPLSFVNEDSTPPYNPSDQPVVQIRSQVSVTHAIREPQQVK